MDPILSVAVEATGKTMMKEVNMLSGLKEQVEGMKTEIQWMQSFLEDADLRVTSQPQQRQSKLFRQSVFQVREASLDAEDIIDQYSVKLALRNRGGPVNCIKRYVCIPGHAIDMHTLGSEIEALKSKISSLKSSIQAYALKELGLGDAGSSSSSGGHARSLQRRSYGHIHDRNVVGLEENIEEVVDLLLKEETANNVISIYGMGGLGKTTLAKKVYNDKRVRTFFDKFAWVCVSQQFTERDVWESTLVELIGSPSGDPRKEISRLTENELLSRLRQLQEDQKCLVVLDDVWSIGNWNKLQHGFHHIEGSTLSKILFTTRNKEVAEHANHRCSYGGLKPLDDNKSLELLGKIALEGRDENTDKKSMEDLGKGMLKHCTGLPLAIVVLGGILASKDSLSEWQTVHDNINSYLRRGKGHDQEQGLGVHQVLAYSYYDLPSPLKSCFLYLSQFPEDHEIKTGKLMRMWIAEGFVSVQYDGEGEEMVGDVAERYLNELVGRCVIETGRKGPMGRVKTCRLHDLMREVCLTEALEENLIHVYKREETMSKVVPKGKIRRLAFFAERSTSTKDDLVSLSRYGRNSQIRSLILNYDGNWLEKLRPVRLLDSFKLLKMLVLEWIDMRDKKDLSKEIGKLIHLRYLSLRFSVIYSWPTLDKLECMETLDLRVFKVESRGRLKVNDIWKMKSLMHLYLPCPLFESYSTDGADAKSMSNVQKLVNFPPPKGRVSGIVEFPNLKKLKVLQGKHVPEFWDILKKGFSFSRLYSFALADDIHNNDRKEKVDLEVLFERCPHLYKLRLDGAIDKFLPLNLFPTKLTKLWLEYSGIEDPKHIETTLGNLPHLRSLQLGDDSFKGEQLSFKKHTFPQLTTLDLSTLNELKNWTVEEGAMPNLECLKIFGVKKLEAIPEGLRFIATLKELKISYMTPDFKARLEEGGADFDTVKHVPSITCFNCD